MLETNLIEPHLVMARMLISFHHELEMSSWKWHLKLIFRKLILIKFPCKVSQSYSLSQSTHSLPYMYSKFTIALIYFSSRIWIRHMKVHSAMTLSPRTISSPFDCRTSNHFVMKKLNHFLSKPRTISTYPRKNITLIIALSALNVKKPLKKAIVSDLAITLLYDFVAHSW